MTSISLRDRYLGCLLGLAVGDAVGTSVEFMVRGSFAPVTDMTGGGPFRLAAGQWTDDTSMALCLLESLLGAHGFDAVNQMGRYLNWWRFGYLSSTGECFDIGNTVRSALLRFEANGDPFAGDTDPASAGNGSLMRLAPVALFYHPDVERVVHFSAMSSRTTHGASEAVECCQLLGLILQRCLAGLPRDEVLRAGDLNLEAPKVAALASGEYVGKSIDQIRGSGYAVEALEAALWCFEGTGDFESAVLKGVNLGDDADTTGAIVGQIAGAFYGVGAIPGKWLERLHLKHWIVERVEMLMDVSWK